MRNCSNRRLRNEGGIPGPFRLPRGLSFQVDKEWQRLHCEYMKVMEPSVFSVQCSASRRRVGSSPEHLRSIRSIAAFTLIELLIVIAVIAVLAGITLAALGGAQAKGARDRTAAEVVALANAIERYKTQNDTYPPATGTNLVFTNIQMFMPASPGSISGNQLLDPYGNPYRYRFPGQVNIATFDVWSGGQSTDNTNDDIGNW